MAECKSCGGFVTEDYARVFGDNEGNIFDCRNCRARSDPEEESDEAGERVVLLRDVTDDEADGTTTEWAAPATTAGGDTSEGAPATSADGGRPTTRTAGTGGTADAVGETTGASNGTGTTTEAQAGTGMGTETGTERDQGGKRGAKERLAGLFSSLRG